MVDQVLTLLDSQPKPHCNNNNNNNNDNIYGAVIVAQNHCESSPGSCDEYGTAPRGCRPSDQAKRPITQPKSSFDHPSEGRILSLPRH